MKCPSCRNLFAAPVTQCPGCGLTLEVLDAKFGAVPRYTRYLTDRSGKLPLLAIRKLRHLLQVFEAKFPQSSFSVFVTDHVPAGSISEYTFWLANRARLSSVGAAAGDNFDLLLGINLGTGEAALTMGYGLESYLTESDLESALGAAESAFRTGDLPRGIRECVRFMMKRLRQVVRASEAPVGRVETVMIGDY